MDLTEAEGIKKRWQKYTELYKKHLYHPDNHDGVITHLEPDILECGVKWFLGSITMKKASGGDGIPVELFRRRIDAFELWCWRRLLRVPWNARSSNQSILKEISPGIALGFLWKE